MAKIIINENGESDTQDIEYGDIFLWTPKDGQRTNRLQTNPLLYVFDRLVSLSEPHQTWVRSVNEIRGEIKDGFLKKAPKGYSVTLIQE